MPAPSLPFRKMHGLGNDFAVFDLRAPDAPAMTAALARAVADRGTGVGCDQVITIEPPRAAGATAFMGIRNPDGGEAGACGNATRCVAALLMAESGEDRCVIETISGLLPCVAAADGLVCADMGPARLDWQDLPLAEARDTLHLDLSAGPLSDPVGVSMGNPHAVFFVPDLAAVPLAEVGPQVEHHALFPQRTNVEVVQVLSPTEVRMRVWERGAGITRACGSGACAVGVAAMRRGLTERRVTVHLDGGPLVIEWRAADGHVLMTGPAATVYVGTLDPGLLP